MKLGDLPRLVRTLRHYRFDQLAAQLRHVLSDEGRAGVARGEAPPFAVERSAVPFLPGPPHARFDGKLGFELIHRAHRFEGSIDWQFDGYGPLWAFHLHQFDWARDPSLQARDRTRVVLDWIAHCERGNGWAPHPISLRLLSFGKLALSPGLLELDASEYARFRASMAQQAETLSRRLEVRLQANHLFSNILGVVFAGLLFDGRSAARWLEFESMLRRELDLQILADGSHVERCPMYHALLLENVLDLLNVARAGGRAPAALVAALEDTAARMLGAHAVWTHPDGEIALLGDSAFDIAHRLERLRDYASSLGVTQRPPPRGQLENAGVYRLESGAFTLIATTGAPAPRYQPGHAHCDALSFELSFGDERVVTDTGVTEYIPGPLRTTARATTSHATIRLDGEEQSEIWSAHRVGGRARCTARLMGDGTVEASCSPWSRPRTRHERRYCVQARHVVIEDAVAGPHETAEITLPMGPDVARVELDSEASQARIVLRSGATLLLELPGGVAWRVERRPWFPRFGEVVERDALVGKTGVLEQSRVVFRALEA